ncbi:MAG: Unknown protein [uncultured Campylobacterales bacterium]|uniref:Endonuclease GajA/Old nuclease/RecF-like AAA domain-containing protein n=1 Tax=uncultured Campylobacterales bacterium TaxID=352960 RepID=A0A6S6SPE7_9BACT|nr:MAG: Unknown protein [uncultured Campylobacterales bacterium]
MSEHFIKEIEIKNFKCFEDFKSSGFGRVNLISGKNNVGKTAFMEACYINVSSKTIPGMFTSLVGIKIRRENLNILDKYVKNTFTPLDFTKKALDQTSDITTKSNINESHFSVVKNDGIKEYIFKIADNKNVKINVNDFSFETSYEKKINFIDSYGFSNANMKDCYSSIQTMEKEEELNQKLKDFDSRIEAFKIIDNIPKCKIDNKYMEITELGDGVRHLVSIVTALYTSKNGYFFIDEIENGIHYTNLDKLWRIILEISNKQGVQVFATTHSKECIESYARVSKQLKDEDIRFIELGMNKYNKLDATVMNSEMFLRFIELGNEVRGW